LSDIGTLPNWSGAQNGIMFAGTSGLSYGYCCGCCCKVVPAQVRVTISGMSDSPTGLASRNGTYDLSWVGHDVAGGNVCKWTGGFGGGLTGSLTLSRVWNPANATPCSETGDHLWWLFMDAGTLTCFGYWSKATSDGGDWAGSYTPFGGLAGTCPGVAGSSATVGSVP